ncbi:MAG: FUSC family protein [Peptococcaceae bacterium]
MKKRSLGMRTFKTGLGIYLALFICSLLGLEKGSLAAITAVVGMQPSLKGSLNTIRNQFLATIIGVIFAVAIAYYFKGNYIVLALAAILTIWFCLRLGWYDSITLAVITLILVGEATRGDFLGIVQNRIIMIIIGLGVAFTLNIVIPPKHTFRLIDKVDELRQAFEDFYHQCVNDIISTALLTRQEVKIKTTSIKNLLEEARSIYALSIENIIGYDEGKEKDAYFLMRKSINAIQSNLERLLEIHRSIVLAPNAEEHQEIRKLIHDYLESIFMYHQKIYGHILFDEVIENRYLNEFAAKEKAVTEEIIKLANTARNLEPLHYYNMVAEGQRIMNKAWSLIESKEKFAIRLQKKNL